VVALLHTCSKLATLKLVIKLRGHAAHRFWEALAVALTPDNVKHVGKLSLLAELPNDVTQKQDEYHLFGMDSIESAVADRMVCVASKFHAVSAASLDCHPVVHEAWCQKHSGGRDVDSDCRPRSGFSASPCSSAFFSSDHVASLASVFASLSLPPRLRLASCLSRSFCGDVTRVLRPCPCLPSHQWWVLALPIIPVLVRSHFGSSL